MAAMTSLLLVISALASANCPEPVAADALSTKIDAVHAAYSALDADGFAQNIEEAALMLPCLSEPVPRKLAAAYHRAIGIQYVTARDDTRAGLALAAAKAVEEGYRFPDSEFPTDHPVRVLYRNTVPSPAVSVPVPAVGDILFDGTAGTQRPGRASIVQLRDGSTIHATAYLFPTNAMPPYEAKPEPVVVEPQPVVPEPEPVVAEVVPDPVDTTGDPVELPDGPPVDAEPKSMGAGVPMLGAAAVVGIGSGVLYGMASSANSQYFDDQLMTNSTTLNAQRAKTNSLNMASSMTGIAALGLGVGAIVVGF